MKLIPTTATAAERLKRQAKKQRKLSGNSLGVELEAAAKASGYTSWKHVTLCVEQSARPLSLAGHQARGLPQELVDILAAEVRQKPPLSDSVRAFKAGLVFAMDVKEVENMRPADEVAECDDLRPYVLADMWRVLVNERDPDTGLDLVEETDSENLVTIAQDDSYNYRFFRFTGTPTPATLSEAFERVLGRYFFPPRYVWLGGSFIDMLTVSSVQVHGQTIFASSPGERGDLAMMYSAPNAEPASSPLSTARLPTIFSSEDSEIFRLDISQLEGGVYESRVSYGQQDIDEGLHPSIRRALESAAGITGPVSGFEIAYRGFVIGTYPLQVIRSQAEQIAQHAVATYRSFNEI